MKKALWLFLPLFALISLTACEKDDDHGDNDVTIEFLSPADGATVDASAVEISIRLTATEENEDSDIYLYAENNPDQILLEHEVHEHEKVIEFNQTVDLSSFPSGTAFILKVEACLDHDCDEQKEASIRFSIQ